MSVRYIAIAAIALALAQAGGAPAYAEYPDHPVTFIVPFAPGGSTDILTRMFAEALHDKLGQPFVVENRPGASMQIGTSAVAKSPPDGSMLVMASSTSLAVNPNIYKSLPYDPINDLAPVGLVGSAYFVLVANPALGPKTLPELIAYIKARPGQLSYASAGHGTPHHLFMELFMKMAGLKMQHVPYKGSVPALTDVMSGVIPVMFVDLLPSLQLIRENKLTAFGVTTTHRLKAVPEIPTIAEAALPGYSALGWFAVMARAGTPRPAIDTLNRVLVDYIKRTDVQDKLQGMAVEPLTSTPEELAAFIPAETAKWGQVVRDAGIAPQ
jgi:tripartite-type tricarboxylate transporter receptor subunit TctC